MDIISIQQKYTDFLHEYDNRVSKNIDKQYVRPYLGVLFRVKGLKYFAPLTSSGKGKKLVKSPKAESLTFYPIDNCKLGGINLNNMIPLVDGVYSKYTDIVNLTPTQKCFHEKQIRILRKNETHIRRKALKIYTLKNSGRLYPNYDAVTCDFKTLEKAAMVYDDKLKENQLKEKYKLTDEKFETYKRVAERDFNGKKSVEELLKNAIYMDDENHFDPEIKAKVVAEIETKRPAKQQVVTLKTQEKIVENKTGKKPSNDCK